LEDWKNLKSGGIRNEAVKPDRGGIRQKKTAANDFMGCG